MVPSDPLANFRRMTPLSSTVLPRFSFDVPEETVHRYDPSKTTRNDNLPGRLDDRIVPAVVADEKVDARAFGRLDEA